MGLTTAIKSCVENNISISRPNPFIKPLDKIFSLTYQMAHKLKYLPENDAPDLLPYKILSEISSGLTDIIQMLKEKGLASNPIDPASYEYLDDPTIYGVVAWGVFKFFEGLSACLGNDDLVRGLAIIPWSEITFGLQINIPLYQRLSVHMLRKVNDNLENFHYPLIVRLMINLNGVSEPNSNSTTTDESLTLHNEFMTLLKNSYKHVSEQKTELANEMLPDSAIYDKDNHRIIKRYIGGGTSFLIIE